MNKKNSVRMTNRIRRLVGSLFYQEGFISRKKILFWIALALFLYCLIIFELVTSGMAQFGHRWPWFYNNVLDSATSAKLQQHKVYPNLTIPNRLLQNYVLKTATGVNSQNDLNDSYMCFDQSDWTLPSPNPETLKDTFVWQKVSCRSYDTYVFSAYYDIRLNFPLVLIIGVSNQYVIRKRRPSTKEYCRLWYPGETTHVVVEAEFRFVPEHHDLRYAASFHTCLLDRQNAVPFAVSLIIDRCCQSTNILRVQYDLKSQLRFNYTVCLSPLNEYYQNYQQLVETVEVNQLFGADHFVFYNLSTGNAILPFISSYVSEGLAKVIPWTIPSVNIHYYGQVAALNDCLYRYLYSSRFIVFTDLDEVIVPRMHNTWNEMIENILLKNEESKSNSAALLFRNTFFRADWYNHSDAAGYDALVRHLGLKTLLLTVREDKIYPPNIRSKYLVQPTLLLMVGIHFPYEIMPFSRTIHVDQHLGLLHHYRATRVFPEGNSDPKPIYDELMYRFYNHIVSRTRARYRRVKTTYPLYEQL